MLRVVKQNYENSPEDLLSIPEFCQKHPSYKYGYLYKWACIKKQIPIYWRGGLKLSEHEVLEFDNERKIKKYGRN